MLTIRARNVQLGDQFVSRPSDVRPGDYLCIAVADTGQGMCSSTIQKAFEPFFTTREGGLGLGLTLSESMADDMGGTLTAFNQLPHGAEFRLSLPLAAPH